ncbi:hypothetical protein C8R43DRAFT_1136130 [Mycena crocata]|nr:hypothetical protein C8R43DRAFT_1136130 [Mycena crocata]
MPDPPASDFASVVRSLLNDVNRISVWSESRSTCNNCARGVYACEPSHKSSLRCAPCLDRKIKCPWEDSYLFQFTQDKFFSRREDFDLARSSHRRRVVKAETLPTPVPLPAPVLPSIVPSSLVDSSSAPPLALPSTDVPTARPLDVPSTSSPNPTALLLTRFPPPISRASLVDLDLESLIQLVLALSQALDSVTVPRIASSQNMSINSADVPAFCFFYGWKLWAQIKLSLLWPLLPWLLAAKALMLRLHLCSAHWMFAAAFSLVISVSRGKSLVAKMMMVRTLLHKSNIANRMEDICSNCSV